MNEDDVLEMFPDANINQIVKTGHGFGEYALIKDLYRTETVIVREETCILSLTKDHYLNYLASHHE